MKKSKKRKKSSIAYVKEIPEINDTEMFIITEDTPMMLAEQWKDFINVTLATLVRHSDAVYTEQIEEYVHKKIGLEDFRYIIRTQLGIVEKIKIVDIEETEPHTHRISMNLDLEEMIHIYQNGPGNSTAKGINTRAILDRFFVFLWAKKLLLYPLTHPKGYQRPSIWRNFLDVSLSTLEREHQVISKIQEHLKMVKAAENRRERYRHIAIYYLVVSTNWSTLDDITESSLHKLRIFVEKRLKGSPSLKKYAKASLNDIRFILIENGRKDILSPQTISRQKQVHVKKMFPSFMYINPQTDKRILDLMARGEQFLEMLLVDGLAKGTLSGYASSLNTLFRFLSERFADHDINEEFVTQIYDPSCNDSLRDYIISKKNSEESMIQKMKQIASFFDYCEILTPSARKNIPRASRKTSKRPYRVAMSAEMTTHIYDILLNRPPQSGTKWYRNKADVSWWPHEVYPVYVMLFLFLYSIPLRGGQARHLCRKRSFVLNDDETKIERFIINTDKNVHRRELLEIPCAWDELQIFVPFLKWHKAYFPNLKEIVYNNDENSPWEKIEPIMILPDSNVPITKRMMMDYHKRLICQYQIEKMQEAKEKGEDTYPVVAEFRDERPFFKSIEALNQATTGDMINIKVTHDIHSLRVTGATRYLEAGLSIPHLMMLTGHTTPNVLLSVYIRLKEEEQREALKSAIHKIRFDDKSHAVEAGKEFVRGEMVEAYEKGDEALHDAIERNDLFSLHRKGGSFEEKLGTMELGTNIVKGIHPTSWRPMIHGICPGVPCPDGRENRCSLCPYFITGRLFLDGIILMTNQLFARFQRETLQMEEEKTKGYHSSTRAEGLQMLLEEILGYYDILEKTEQSIVPVGADNLPQEYSGAKRVLVEQIPENLAYLKNAYDADLFGVEQDRYGMKVLTIQAMKLAASHGDTKRVESLDDGKETIDYLMGHYKSSPEALGSEAEIVGEFVKSIGYKK